MEEVCHADLSDEGVRSQAYRGLEEVQRTGHNPVSMPKFRAYFVPLPTGNC